MDGHACSCRGGGSTCRLRRRAGLTLQDALHAGFRVDQELARGHHLLARLQAITRRGRSESTTITVGDLHLDLLARRATRAGRRLNLTAKEFALLVVLGRRQSQIVSKTIITELVWDINFDTNTNVVEVAIKRLRAKIDGMFETKLLHTVRGMGYVLEHRPEGTAP